MNETLGQLVDAVRTIQEDQSKMCGVIDKLATKVTQTQNTYLPTYLPTYLHNILTYQLYQFVIRTL